MAFPWGTQAPQKVVFPRPLPMQRHSSSRNTNPTWEGRHVQMKVKQTCQLKWCRSGGALKENLQQETAMRWALKRGQIWEEGKGGHSQGRRESPEQVGSKPEECRRQAVVGNLIVGGCYFSHTSVGPGVSLPLLRRGGWSWPPGAELLSWPTRISPESPSFQKPVPLTCVKKYPGCVCGWAGPAASLSGRCLSSHQTAFLSYGIDQGGPWKPGGDVESGTQSLAEGWSQWNQTRPYSHAVWGHLTNRQKHQIPVLRVGKGGLRACWGKERRPRVSMAGFKSSPPFTSCVPWARFSCYLCLSFLVWKMGLSLHTSWSPCEDKRG